MAVDIGASSGRHILGFIENGKIKTREIYRFPNGAGMVDGRLVWDWRALFEHILEGMACCAKAGYRPASVGIDTWGVDYVLIDKDGEVLTEAVCYRDGRTAGEDARLETRVPAARMYARTGIQKQIFNTVYQLSAHLRESPGDFERARELLLMPDLFHFLLCGNVVNEYTNATSTGLVNAVTRDWDRTLIGELGLPGHLFAHKPVMPGVSLGRLKAEVCARVGFDCQVAAPATHDTGSAFVAVPARDGAAVRISSGTWSLLGVENSVPVTTSAAQAANFTNEGGFGGSYRFLKNIMGMWMLQSLRKETNEPDFTAPARWAAAETGFTSVVDVGSDRFLAPASMKRAVQDFCLDTGQPVPQNRGQVAQCIYHSLAQGYRAAITQLSGITGQNYDGIHIVGGGSRDGYLCRLTADATGLPVYAGPAEGTALGNIMAQMIAAGVFADMAQARIALRESVDVTEYQPNKQEVR